MASFTKGITDSDTFGKNVYWRSTVGLKYESGTVAADTIPTETWDGVNGTSSTERILQAGEALARITSGPNAGFLGPFQLGVTDGRQDVANLVGVNDTFTPWQAKYRNVDVGYCYEGTLVQAKCFIRDATGARIAMTNAVATALVATKSTSITFH